MGLRLITPPATDPVSLAVAKAHLRVVDSENDTIISALIKASTTNVEAWLGRALIDQTWDLYIDGFPTAEIKIPLPPLIEVLEINYDDSDGNIQTVNAADYYVDSVSQPGWVVPAGNLTWPTTLDAINSVRVRFRAGYLSEDSPPVENIPFDIKAAILLNLGSLYEHRETVVIGQIATHLPWGAENLLRPHRVLLGMA